MYLLYLRLFGTRLIGTRPTETRLIGTLKVDRVQLERVSLARNPEMAATQVTLAWCLLLPTHPTAASVNTGHSSAFGTAPCVSW